MIRPVISVHVPKAGGTSTAGDLRRQFGDRARFDYGRGPLGPERDQAETGLPQGVELVHGHFRPGRYDAVGPAFRFTFLRQPTDLLLSFYFYWRDMPFQGLDLHRRFLDEAPAIEAFAAWEPIRRLTSETYFGGYDMSRFDFIGFHETRARDMAALNAAADLRLDPDRRDNVTASGGEARAALRADARRMGLLADLLADDMRFYERLRAARG